MKHLAALSLVSFLSALWMWPVQAGEAKSVSGRWKLAVSSEGEERDYFLDLEQQGKSVGGKFISPRSGEYKISKGSFENGTLKLEIPREIQGQEFVFEVEAKVGKDGTLTGNLTVMGQEFGAITITREKPKLSLAGKWKLSVVFEGEGRDYFLDLEHDGESVGGKFISPRSGEYKISKGSFENGTLKLEIPREIQGQEFVFEVEAKVGKDGTLTGDLTVMGQEFGTITITREKPKPSLAGKWEVSANSPDGTREWLATLDVAMDNGGNLGGTYSGEAGEFGISSVEVDGGKASFEVALKLEGNEVPFIVQVEFKSADTLDGKWIVKDNDEVSGKWSAKRVETSPFSGIWDATATMTDGEKMSFVLELEASSGGKLGGKFLTQEGKAIGIDEGKVDGKKLGYSIQWDRDGEALTIRVEGELDGEGGITGKWSDGTDDGGWSAKKREPKSAEPKSAKTI